VSLTCTVWLYIELLPQRRLKQTLVGQQPESVRINFKK